MCTYLDQYYFENKYLSIIQMVLRMINCPKIILFGMPKTSLTFEEATMLTSSGQF